jgi:hypothetical protein
MHHADAGIYGRLAISDVDGFAVDADFTGIGGIEAVKDRHQSRFPRSVFPNNAVDATLGNGEIDILVGVHGAEFFIDTDKLDRRFHRQPKRLRRLDMKRAQRGYRDAP